MTDCKKVIKGLEMIRRTGGCPDVYYMDCKNCVYDDDPHCVDSILRDAISLLKAQEPRVMTLEEVWKASVASEPIWIELIDVGLLCLPLCAILEDENDNQYAVFTTQYSAIRCPFGKYGKTWRCWTSRPTDEQREAIPWQG